ncbi:hypothetical protein [Parahaliea mediterranea]|uniref:Uncharacterized protein n=1 Tax=Parahaliea mediterranea TaxID=651086 RepID=A0A939DDQ2_9GAMM|nr:hypothetical protein [Parahaliea mediterranea]MBN7796288.1 hypothetical protein [Parahaliea mediterranea]
MKKYLGFGSLFVVFLIVSACGTVSVSSNPKQKISRDAKITVVAPTSDDQNITGQIEHLLLSHGFSVTSESVGRTQIEYRESEIRTEQTTSRSGSVGVVTRLPTELILRFSYNAYFDVFYWSFTRFNGTVVDLEDGKVIASVSFSGDKSVTAVLTDFTNQLGAMAQ